jgi:hypothetical protein
MSLLRISAYLQLLSAVFSLIVSSLSVHVRSSLRSRLHHLDHDRVPWLICG